MQELSTYGLDAIPSPPDRHPGLAFAAAGLIGAALGLALFFLIRPDRPAEREQPPPKPQEEQQVPAASTAPVPSAVPPAPAAAAPVTTAAPIAPVVSAVPAPIAVAPKPKPTPKPKPKPLTTAEAKAVAARVQEVLERYADPRTSSKQLRPDLDRLLRDGDEPAALEVYRLVRHADRLQRALDVRIADREEALRKIKLRHRLRGLPTSERGLRVLELSRKRIKVLKRRRDRLAPMAKTLQVGLAGLRTPGARRARRRLLEARNAELMRAWRVVRRERKNE